MAKARKVKSTGKPKSKMTVLERQTQEAAERNHLDYARRHPERAKAERGLRVARVQLLDRWSHKAQGTPETHEHFNRPREGAIARLHSSGTLNADQLAWAAEIAAAFEQISAPVAVRSAKYERSSAGGQGGEFWESLAKVRIEVAYSRWRTGLGELGGVVLEIIAHDVGLTNAARLHRVHVRRARAALLRALDQWGAAREAACGEVDAATLAAAQAGIL